MSDESYRAWCRCLVAWSLCSKPVHVEQEGRRTRVSQGFYDVQTVLDVCTGLPGFSGPGARSSLRYQSSLVAISVAAVAWDASVAGLGRIDLTLTNRHGGCDILALFIYGLDSTRSGKEMDWSPTL